MARKTDVQKMVWEGALTPARFTRTPDVWRREEVIRGRGRFGTQYSVYLKSPNPTFPWPSLVFSINNAKGNCYAQFTDVTELRRFATHLSDMADEVETSYTMQAELASDLAVKIELAQREMADQREKLRLVKNIADQMNGSGDDDDDEDDADTFHPAPRKDY